MLRFAAVSIVCAILYILATLLYLPAAVKFGKDLDKFQLCARNGIPTRYFNETTGKINSGVDIASVQNKDKHLNATLATCGDITK